MRIDAASTRDGIVSSQCDQALLGFAVPTFRRPELLDLALKSIVDQAVALNAPVFIPDNSCDKTNVPVVEKWRRIYPNIFHHINETNIGIDRNVDRAIVRCPSTYVHVIGDDDQLLPTFAKHVLSAIRASAPSHIICSYMYVLNDYRATTGLPIIPPRAATPTLRSFLPEYGWTLGFIGAHVFRRDRFAKCLVDGFGSYFSHIVKLINYLDPDEPLGFVEQPLVSNRVDDESTPTWSGDRLNVVFGLEKVFYSTMKGRYSVEEIDRTVQATRRSLGYTQFTRLLYWAALAERAGVGLKYWHVLRDLIPGAQYSRLRSVPRTLYLPLITAMPVIRSFKRGIRRMTL